MAKQRWPFRFARFLLAADAQKKSNIPVWRSAKIIRFFKLVVNNAHPDLKIIERDYTDTDRRKIMKAIKDGEQLSDEELKGA